jgi:acetylornithine deacetylase
MNEEELERWFQEIIRVLSSLISTPSFSREEGPVTDVLTRFLESHKIKVKRKGNNIWARNKFYNPSFPTLLLNSHLDTVRPNSGYTRDPFHAEIEEGKLFGLGSNDAGGALICLAMTFVYFYAQKGLLFNLAFAATAEEEISGLNGIESILEELSPIHFAIVGEPTLMNMAVAERGLMVIDCVRHGRAGHAARMEGENALLGALEDLNWFHHFKFPDRPNLLGPVRMSPTVIRAGQEHNVVPAECHYTVDIRVPDAYSHEEILETIRKSVKSTVVPRSMRLKSSLIPDHHPLVQAGLSLGLTTYGSPTTSDKALIPVPSLKLGPGDSARSHTANEFIYIEELKEGFHKYVSILNALNLYYETLGKRA